MSEPFRVHRDQPAPVQDPPVAWTPKQATIALAVGGAILLLCTGLVGTFVLLAIK